MTDGVLIAAIAIIPTTIASIVGLIIGLRTQQKADIIKSLTNGNYTALNNKLEIANIKIEHLEQMVLQASRRQFSTITTETSNINKP